MNIQIKILLTTLLIIFCPSAISGEGASGGGAKMSWNQILSNNSYKAHFHSLQAEGRFFTLNSFCVDGNVLKTKKTSQRCTRWGDGRSAEHDPVCIKSKAIRFETDFNYYDLKNNIEVFELMSRDREKYLFTKEYKIPNCKF